MAGVSSRNGCRVKQIDTGGLHPVLVTVGTRQRVSSPTGLAPHPPESSQVLEIREVCRRSWPEPGVVRSTPPLFSTEHSSPEGHHARDYARTSGSLPNEKPGGNRPTLVQSVPPRSWATWDAGPSARVDSEQRLAELPVTPSRSNSWGRSSRRSLARSRRARTPRRSRSC